MYEQWEDVFTSSFTHTGFLKNETINMSWLFPSTKCPMYFCMCV